MELIAKILCEISILNALIYMIRKTQGILLTIMLAYLSFINSFGWYGSKEGNYSRHSMLDFTLCLVVTPEDYYLSMKYRWKTLYVSSSYLFTSLTVTDTIGE